MGGAPLCVQRTVERGDYTQALLFAEEAIKFDPVAEVVDMQFASLMGIVVITRRGQGLSIYLCK